MWGCDAPLNNLGILWVNLKVWLVVDMIDMIGRSEASKRFASFGLVFVLAPKSFRRHEHAL